MSRLAEPPEAEVDSDPVLSPLVPLWFRASDMGDVRLLPTRFDRRLRSGELCGPFEVTRCVEATDSRHVYEARHSYMGRTATLKTYPIRQALEGRSVDIFHEAQDLTEIRHANLETVWDAGVEHQVLWIAGEPLRGRSLRARLSRGVPLEAALALHVAEQVASGLQVAHERRIVHRDLRPEVIILETEGHVVVTDLGVARLLRLGAGETPGKVLGTPAYIAPERLLGESEDRRADVYSLGLILYEMLAGRHPYARSDTPLDLPDPKELARQQILEIPPRLDILAPWVPAPLADIVDRATDKNPDRRPGTMDELASELRVCRREIATGSIPSVRTEAPPVTQMAWAWVATALLVFGLLAGALALVLML